MGLAHFVRCADKVFIFHLFNRQAVPLIGFFGRAGNKLHAVTLDNRLAHAVHDIAADRTDIEQRAQHVCRRVSVADFRAGKQFRDRNAQYACNGRQKRNIRIALASFPLGYRLVGNAQFLCQLGLRHAAFFPQAADGGAGDILVHKDPSHAYIISCRRNFATYAK